MMGMGTISRLALFSFIVALAALSSGCSEECTDDFSCPDRDQLCQGGKCSYKKCEFNTDCQGRLCFSGRCSDGRCSFDIERDCCGNNVCEKETEDICSCKTDCKSFETMQECSGPIKIGQTSSGKPINSEYIGYSCRDSIEGRKKCLIGINEGAQKTETLLDSKSLSGFTLQTKIRYNNPFDIEKDSVELEFSLKDLLDYIKPPIRINEVRIMSDEKLLGLKQTAIFLNTIGSTDSATVPFEVVLTAKEEEWRLKLEIDYQYTKLKGVEEEVIRSTYTYSIGKTILVDIEE